MSSIYWVTEADAYLEPKVSSGGPASQVPETIIDVFKQSFEAYSENPAMALKRAGPDGIIPTEWKYWTYREYYTDCQAFAKSLVKFNITTFKVVNILGFNSPGI